MTKWPKVSIGTFASTMELTVEISGTLYEHSPEPVVENTNVKILWDFTIQTDKKMPNNRPDIVIVEKINKICHNYY